MICRGNNRQVVFRDERDRKRYLEKLCLYCEQKEVELLAYCLLSNHVHLLLETPKGNLSKMMQAFQTSYTVYFNKRHRRTGHVFEQRYKAYLVDKDSYLLEVSRYIHMNPVMARIVERPGDHPWSSYSAYLSGKGIAALEAQKVLDYFAGGKGKQRAQYREFVEGMLRSKEKWTKPPVVKQAFIGDEDFVEQARRKAAKLSILDTPPAFKRIVKAVCQVSDLVEDDIKRSGRSEAIQRAREIVCYISRRHGDVGLRELARFLGVKELSTPTHGVRRAEQRIERDPGFRRQVERVLKLIGHSSMQA